MEVSSKQSSEMLKKQLTETFSSALMGLGISVGYNLHIFDAIAKVATEESPATALAIADECDLKERYVREWLGAMVCAGIVETDKSGKKFWIKDDCCTVLSGPNPFFLLPALNLIRLYSDVADKVEKIFAKDGPLGASWNDYKGFQKYIEIYTEGRWGKNYADKFLRDTGFEEEIKTRCKQAVDIGCGNGYHLETFSKALPNIKFTGVDLSKEGILNAKKRQVENGLNNVDFLEMDGQKMPKDWTGRFDWVMMFDCAHDQPRPDLTFNEIHRILKDDGIFTMVDIDGTGNIYLDREKDAEGALVSYLFSTFICLPCSSSTNDALCLGSKWGRDRAVELLKDNGFPNVKVIPLNVKEQVLYVCKK